MTALAIELMPRDERWARIAAHAPAIAGHAETTSTRSLLSCAHPV